MAATPRAIDVRDISKSFGTVDALTDVTLSAERGEIVGLLGPNGAGKTTLVRIVATLLEPDAGTVHIAGVDVASHPAAARRHLGLAGQFAALDDLLTGEENLELIGTLYGLDRDTARQRSRDLLVQFGLAEAGARRVATYSGGMRRRLDLGATLIGRPSVLLLDEPTAGLDPRTRAELWRVVGNVAEAGTTVLLTSQYLEEIERLASRVVVLDRGRVIAEGSTNELKRRIGGHVVEARVGRPEQLDAARSALAAVAADGIPPATTNDRVSVSTAGDTSDLIAAVHGLDRAHVDVVEVGLRLPLLDDVFMALTGSTTLGDSAGEGGDGPTAPLAVDRGFVAPAAHDAPARNRLWSDLVTVTKLNLVRLARTPQLLFFATVQPVLFVLGLSVVFEGLVEAFVGVDYIQYLIPGVLVMNVMLAAGSTGVGIAQDMQTGIIDRFRSLPMSRVAVLVGRTSSDLVRNAFAMALMIAAGFLIGYRLEGSVGYALAGFGLALAFGYACTWMFAAVGLAVKDPQAAQFAGFAPVLPLVYLSGAWVPVETMKPAVRGFATHQPVNVTIDAVRSLASSDPDWTSVWRALAWSAVILVTFVLVASRQFARAR